MTFFRSLRIVRSIVDLAVVVIMATAYGVASADGLIVESAPSRIQCLSAPSKELLKYPEGMALEKSGGVLRVRMTFKAPDAEPDVQIFYDSVGDAFRTAVLQFVSHYRLPCQPAGSAPTVATQEFQFTPDDGRPVLWAEAREDENSRARNKSRPDFMACLTGLPRPPAYPVGVRYRDGAGVVLAQLEFSGPDRAPEVKILFDGGDPAFARVVREFTSHYRLPCLPALEAPLRAMQPFRFQIEGEGRSMLKDATVASFAGVVDPAYTQDVRFDFTSMSCPFDVRFVLRRPYFANGVGEVASRDDNRREFLEWLMRLDLKIDDRVRRQVIGDSMTISVPCGVLDLRERIFTPQEKR